MVRLGLFKERLTPAQARGDPYDLGELSPGRRVGRAEPSGPSEDQRSRFRPDWPRVELAHRATDRSIFARGALEAAHWLSGQSAGSYDLDAMLSERAAR